LAALFVGSLALVVVAACTPLPAELADGGGVRFGTSVRYLDRDGALLREVRADDAARARWASGDELGPVVPRALLAAEDRRFYAHPGVDPVGIVRAVVTSLWARRVVSGASTLTMQLARLLRPHPKTLVGKLGEIALALRIEASRILEEYANRAPFGPGLRGIDAASRFYFDKPPASLSLAEAATLAAIPRGPAVYSLKRHPERVLRRRDRILERMLRAGWIDQAAATLAWNEPLAVHPSGASFGAPHFVEAIAAGAFPGEVGNTVHTTLASTLQREAELAAARHLAPLADRHVTAASVVVLDNTTGETLAYVGSPDYDDLARGGRNDGVRAHRQPGSTLKPFVYGLAMEKLGYTAATVLPDVELSIEVPQGVYAPKNYDERFHGPVRLRDALGNSLNVPAVQAGRAVGIDVLLDRLRQLGFAGLTEDAEYYGPALALGDGEVTLLELANAYATLARGGVFLPVRAIRGGGEPASEVGLERRIFPAEVASVLTDVLSDPAARVAAFGLGSALDLPGVAAKTGTSKGFRDNWTVGYTPRVTVAVWVGNFDGSPMHEVSGITGAGPIFRAVMDAAMRYTEAHAPADSRGLSPPGNGAADDGLEVVEVCALSGEAPTRACPHVLREKVPHGTHLERCTMHERVAIDRRDGLRAGPSCPPGEVAMRTFERFDPPFAAWARAAGRDMAPSAYSPRCPAATGQDDRGRVPLAPLAIVYPRDGARFLYDPGRAPGTQGAMVRIDAPAPTARVALRVDGRVVQEARGGPFVFDWPLAPGEHVLMAEAPGFGASEAVRVWVE
jgi:penicillin-binding protein 1C